MEELSKNRIFVDKDLRPAYYDDFHCLAADCNISCCKGWNISFDKKDFLTLKRQKGTIELNERLQQGVRRIRRGPTAGVFYGEFNMDTGVCPLLQADGLCRIQAEKSHGVLPLVCRQYPRGESYLPSGYLERTLSPSCEGVLALLWDLPNGIEFRSDPLPDNEKKWLSPPPGYNPLSMYFAVVREWCVDLLQDRRFSLPQRIWLMGLGLQKLSDGELDIQHWIEWASALPNSADTSQVLPTGDRELSMFLSSCVHTLLATHTTDPVLRPVRGELLQSLKIQPTGDEGELMIPFAPYREARIRFEAYFGNHSYFMENLMVAIFFYLHMPYLNSEETLWKGFVNFCNLYAIMRFLSVMSCREGAPGDRSELFKLIVYGSRALLHNADRQTALRDEYFRNDSATLAHMAILLGG